MNPYTSLAVDAFRKQELARRRLARLEGETAKAVRRVPSGPEFEMYVLQTEIIQLEMSAKDAKDSKDKDAADQALLAAARLRETLRELYQ
jgi:hypothetical protein